MTKEEATKLAIEWLGYHELTAEEEQTCPAVDRVVVRLSDYGSDGPGWYAWDAEYPDEGSVYLGAP